jgi:hypothetical protein
VGEIKIYAGEPSVTADLRISTVRSGLNEVHFDMKDSREGIAGPTLTLTQFSNPYWVRSSRSRKPMRAILVCNDGEDDR